MATEEYNITLEDLDTEGQMRRLRFVPEGDDEWLRETLGPERKARLRIRPSDEEADTEGHAARGGIALRVVVEADDDTEGHAISLRFPNTADADLFRRRLLASGVLVGAVALGATAGGALGDRAATGGADAGAAATSISGEYAADRGVGVAPQAAAAGTAVSGEYAADRGVGVAPQAAAGTAVSGEYAADRGVGVAPEPAGAAEEEAPEGGVNRSQPTLE